MQEAEDHTHKHIRTVNEYMEMRRDSVGMKTVFAILEMGLNLPDEVVHHPVINELSTLALEMVLLDNVSRDATANMAKLTVIAGHDFIQQRASMR